MPPPGSALCSITAALLVVESQRLAGHQSRNGECNVCTLVGNWMSGASLGYSKEPCLCSLYLEAHHRNSTVFSHLSPAAEPGHCGVQRSSPGSKLPRSSLSTSHPHTIRVCHWKRQRWQHYYQHHSKCTKVTAGRQSMCY